MAAFGELLTTYMARTGIGDAELARRIPVSRLTLVRWKEGVTARPRYRDDVLRCAELLRLTPEETDQLLLSAGYSPEHGTVPPETPIPPGEPVPPESTEPPEAAVPDDNIPIPAAVPSPPPPEVPAPSARRRWPRWALAAALAVVLLVSIAGVAILSRPDQGPSGPLVSPPLPTINPTVAVTPTVGPPATTRPTPTTPVPRDTAVYPVAANGESLIVMAPFINYTAGAQGFNVAGRLRAGIDREVREAGLTSVRTVQWPRDIRNEPEALSAVATSGAALMIWGEYDSGRVMARFTVPPGSSAARAQQVVDIASSPAELPAAINIGLIEEVRHVALLTLGQLYLEQGKFDDAKTVLIRAMDPPPAEQETLANLRFLLGSAYMGGQWADFDEAIWLFTQVLAVQPNSVESLNSRGLAYLDRDRPGDADLAVADLTRAADLRPGRAATHLNLAVAYLRRAGDRDTSRALDSLSRALAEDPAYAGAFVNRAGLYISRGQTGDLDLAFADLDQALAIDPSLAEAHINRANAHIARAGRQDLELAIAELTRAIQLSPDSPAAFFNRGLVYSQLGSLEKSIADLRRARELQPLDYRYNRTLCLQLAVAGEPEAALPFCDSAVEGDPDGLSRDSRGVVHALLGNYDEAIADFEAFAAWVSASSRPGCRDLYHDTRASWIASLRAAVNPIDAQVLDGLRPRPVLPGHAPC